MNFVSTPVPARTRPQRADARRNLQLLVQTAHDVFAERGTSVPLDEIAERAGVGIGTLYRHFPNREALLAALLADGLRELVIEANELERLESPGDAVVMWLRSFIDHASAYPAITSSFNSIMQSTPEFASLCNDMHSAFDRLVNRAKASGEIDPVASAADVILLANAIVWAKEQVPVGPEYGDRLLQYLLNGLFVPTRTGQRRKALPDPEM
jgi:AcrR family transcriptional regulator